MDETRLSLAREWLLVEQATALEPGFAELLPDAELLTPYATAFRYPDEPSEPTQEEFTEALEAAGNVLQLVLGLHPELTPDEA